MEGGEPALPSRCAALVLDAGPIAYWRLGDRTGTAVDERGVHPGMYAGEAPSPASARSRRCPNFSIGGRLNQKDQPFIGAIDEVAVYDHALPPNTIAAHHILGARGL